MNHLGLPIREYYTTQDVCKVLVVKPDTFGERIYRGYYPEPIRVGGKHRFTMKQVTEIMELTMRFLKDGVFKVGK